jgi:hypothetical protein
MICSKDIRNKLLQTINAEFIDGRHTFSMKDDIISITNQGKAQSRDQAFSIATNLAERITKFFNGKITAELSERQSDEPVIVKIVIPNSTIEEYYEAVPNELKKEYESRISEEEERGIDIINAQEEGYLQLPSLQSSKASSSTLRKVREWMRRAGIDEKRVQQIDVNGQKIDANGIARILENLVEIVEGKENIALPEEAMHFAVEIVEQTNPSLFSQMLSKIDKYNIYRNVLNTYQSVYIDKSGKPDIRKIKKEAIAKLLVEQIIKQNEGITERPELLQQSRVWWKNIIEWIKALLFRANFNPFEQVGASILSGDVNELNNEAKRLADRILEKDFGGLTDLYKIPMQDAYVQRKYIEIISTMSDQLKYPDTFNDRVERMLNGDIELANEINYFARRIKNNIYYQLTDNQKDIVAALDEKLRKFGITKVEQTNPETEEESVSYYQKMVDGKPIKVKKRVTDLVKEKQPKDVIAKFENAPPIQKKRRRNQAGIGVKGHKDIENIIKSVLTSDGTLKPRAEVNIPSGNLLPATAYGALVNYLIGTDENPGILYQTHIFPVGTIFKTEQIVYDENRDLAGTIDLIAVQPNGKVSVLDWKFIFQNVAKYNDVAFFKQRDIRLQLGQYRQILGTYGVDYNNFNKLQAIPIHLETSGDKEGNVTLTALTTASPDITEEKRRYLLPVAAVDQSTGNDILDRYIKSLYGLYESLYAQRPSPEKREAKLEQLNSISGAIRELQIKQNFEPFYQQAQVFLKNTEDLIEEYYSKFAGKAANSSDITDEQINDFLSRVNVIKENLPKYADLYSVFSSIYGDENLTEEHKVLSEKLSRLSGKASKFIKDLDIVYAGDAKVQGFVPTFVAERETQIKNLQLPEKTTDYAGRNFSIQSLVQTTAMQAGGNIYAKAVNQAAVDKQTTLDEYSVLVKAFNKAGHKLSTIVDESNNTLIRKVKKEAYDRFNEATNPLTVDIAWLKQNVDLDAYKAWTDEFIKKRSSEIMRENFPHESQEELNKAREDKIKELVTKYSILNDTSMGWYAPKLRSFLKVDKYYTDEYAKLLKPENKAALELYNFMEKFNKYAERTGYHDTTRSTINRFLPWVRSSTYDRLKQGEGLKGVYEGFQSLWKINADEEVHYGRQNPNTGEVIKSIPIFFAHKKEGESYSKDIERNFALYINSVINHAYAAGVEDKLHAILNVEKAKGRLEVDRGGNIKVLEGGKLAEVPNNERNASLFESFIDSTVYQERFSKDQPVSPEGVKTIENFNKYFRLKVFALNLITPFVNTFGGNLQALINAGRYWKSREFFKNELKVVQNHFKGSQGNIEKGLIDYFIPLNDDINMLTARQLTKDQLNKWSISEILMSPMRYTDRVIQTATGLTMIENAMLDDNGNIVSIRDYVRNEYAQRYSTGQDFKNFKQHFNKRVNELKATKSLIKIAKFNEAGHLELPGISRKSDAFINFRKKIQNEIKRINGSLSEEDRRNGDRNIVQKSMMMFKNWIPLTVESRYGDLKRNAATGEYQMGRARIFWQILIHGAKGNKFSGLLTGLKDLRDMTAVNERGLKLLSDYYKRASDSYYKKTGKKLEMTKEEFYDMVRQAIISQVKDNIMLLSLFSSFVFIKTHAPDEDDDDATKNLYRTTLRVLDKAIDEISFYYNPVSFKQVLGGTLIPSIGVLNDAIGVVSHTSRELYGISTDNEEMQENAHPTKVALKSIPVANWLSSVVLPLVDPETAKELGIQVSTESRR